MLVVVRHWERRGPIQLDVVVVGRLGRSKVAVVVIFAGLFLADDDTRTGVICGWGLACELL